MVPEACAHTASICLKSGRASGVEALNSGSGSVTHYLNSWCEPGKFTYAVHCQPAASAHAVCISYILAMRDGLIEKWRENPSPRHFEKLIAPWANLKDEFRNEGFYERFPAKGQIERVRVIEQRLLREIE